MNIMWEVMKVKSYKNNGYKGRGGYDYLHNGGK